MVLYATSMSHFSLTLADKIRALAEKVMKWCHGKIRQSKCVGILHAQFINDKEVYIIALSGTGYKLDVKSSDDVKLQLAPYNTVWKKLKNVIDKMVDIPVNVIMAEFDAVHKDCLVKYTGEINDQKFFEEWRMRLKYWIGEWHKHYNKNKQKLNLTINRLVEQGMKDTYLEQMKVESPTEEEAELRFKDIVDFLVDCIPEYQPNSNDVSLRMKILEILQTKNPDEIRCWFCNELATKLSQFKTTFERLCSDFTYVCHIIIIY